MIIHYSILMLVFLIEKMYSYDIAQLKHYKYWLLNLRHIKIENNKITISLTHQFQGNVPLSNTFDDFTDACFPLNATGNSRCKNLLAQTDLSDEEAGIILTVAALLLIVLCLFVVVKLLNSLFRGTMASLVKRFINADFPGKFGWLTGYVAILVGTGRY